MSNTSMLFSDGGT